MLETLDAVYARLSGYKRVNLSEDEALHTFNAIALEVKHDFLRRTNPRKSVSEPQTGLTYGALMEDGMSRIFHSIPVLGNQSNDPRILEIAPIAWPTRSISYVPSILNNGNESSPLIVVRQDQLLKNGSLYGYPAVCGNIAESLIEAAIRFNLQESM